MEIAITYLIFVIIISIIGSTRGRGLGGFFMSLLLSPLVGLIWVLAMPNLKADKEEKVVIKKEELSVPVINEEKLQDFEDIQAQDDD